MKGTTVMWHGRLYGGGIIKGLNPDNEIEGLNSGSLRFLQLISKEYGNEYLFQIETSLGCGKKRYNLSMSIKDNVSTWSVSTIDEKSEGEEAKFVDGVEKRNGLELAKKLVITIPKEVYESMEFNQPYEWLINEWNSATM